MIFVTIVQIELSPIIWSEIGLSSWQSYVVVTSISIVMVLIHVAILEGTLSILGIKHKSKPNLGHKIAKVIHKWGLLGLFIVGVIPWPIIIGVALPITYILYCELEKKVWYKPNLGFLILSIGIAIKMLFFV